MSAVFLNQNQTPSERVKQQKKSEERKESKREWYQRNKSECIQSATNWIKENPEQRQIHIQKYVHKNSARTRFWKPYAIPTDSEMEWIENFGQLKNFDATNEKLSKRLTLEIADLKESSKIIKRHHYLHRGRTMSQLPYWICIDGEKVGVLLYSLPRVSNPIDGIEPMKLLELARLWINPSVQNLTYEDRNGKSHSLPVASCAMGKSIKRVRNDWEMKYPNLPGIDAIVSWCDDTRHEGTIYKSSNFKVTGKSGGNSHGAGKRKVSGNYMPRKDFRNIKTRFLYRFNTAPENTWWEN